MRAFVLLPLLLAACAQPPAGGVTGCDGQIEVRNGASFAVEQLYIATTGPANWGRDLLGSRPLAVGTAQPFTVQPGLNAVRVVFVNGRAAEMQAMDVCATPVLKVEPNGLQASR